MSDATRWIPAYPVIPDYFIQVRILAIIRLNWGAII